jgi:hypothetical protein
VLGGALLVATFAIYEMWLAVRLWRVLPYMDQWEAVRVYELWTTGQRPLLDLLVMQHNEHRLPLTRLAFLADFAFFQGRSTFVLPLLLLTHVTLGAALGLVAARGRPAGERALAVAIGVAVMVSPLQIDNLVLPFHLQWAACGLFSLAALYAAARLSEPTGKHALLVPLAAIFTLAGVYSSANGVATALCVAAMAAVLPMQPRARLAIAAAALLSIAAFFVGYEFPPGHEPLHPALRSAWDIGRFFSTIAAVLGSFAQCGGLAASIIAGVLGVSAWIALGVFLSARRRAAEEFDAAVVAMWMLATAALATAAMVAVGRGAHGPEGALITRYGTWALLFWLPLLAAGYRMTLRERWSRPAAFAAAIVVMALSFASGLKPLAASALRADLLRAMTAQLRAGLVPARLDLIYPDAASVLARLELMRQLRLSIFASGQGEAAKAGEGVPRPHGPGG